MTNALCWLISRETKRFLSSLARGTISLQEFFRQVFSRKNFSQKKCGAKLATVANQPVTRPTPTYSGKKNSLQPVESIDSYRSG